MRNAEVQLDLARRGRWDLSLAVQGTSSLEGAGADEDASGWWLNVGVEVSAVDPRVTQSLVRQAEANIVRFREAIAARENTIFVDTLEPLVRIDTLGESRDRLRDLLPQYVDDYTAGISEYAAGTLNMDDLISRRESLAAQQFEVAHLTFMVDVNIAELCAATGKFFELLNESEYERPLPVVTRVVRRTADPHSGLAMRLGSAFDKELVPFLGAVLGCGEDLRACWCHEDRVFELR